MRKGKANDSSETGMTAGEAPDLAQYARNTANNLETILRTTGWTQKRLAEEIDVSQPMMVEYVRGKRLLPLSATLKLVSSAEVQRAIPFTIDQFLTGDIQYSGANLGSEFVWSPEESVHKDLLGTYYLCLFDQKMQDVGAVPQLRRLRYGVMSFYETARKNGGVMVLVAARLFKSEEEACAFRTELDGIEAPEGEGLERALMLYRSHEDTYTGSVSHIGSQIFIDFFSKFYHDKGMIILTAPEKKPGVDYIGGLGNIISVTRGAEHVPVSQKIILSRNRLVASDEEITSHLLYGNVKIDVSRETQAILDLLETFYSPREEGQDLLGGVLDEEDKQVILQRRLQQLIKNYVERTFNGLCLVSKQDDHACYTFLKRMNRD